MKPVPITHPAPSRPAFLLHRLPVYLLLALLLTALPGQGRETPVVLVVGDSLSAGYGLNLEQGWVHLLKQRLDRQGYPHRVVNASISGDTTRGGLSRLPAALDRHDPAVVVLELGGNDGLRGLSLQAMEDNLSRMIQASQASGARVLLMEMRIPPNYGPRYTQKFQQVYDELAQRYDVPLVPFFLADVALDPALMQGDGIHPTAQAQPRMLEQVWPYLKPLLDTAQAASSAW